MQQEKSRGGLRMQREKADGSDSWTEAAQLAGFLGKEKFYVIFVYTLRFRVFGNDFYLFCDH